MTGGRKRAYTSWSGMIQRCTNPKSTGWHRYGGRGISVCERWLANFENFLADMGERPESLTLDRIDGNGNYEPNNCRWATWKEQNKADRKSGKRAGQPPKYGMPMTVRGELKLTAADAAEIEAAIPAGFSHSRWVVEAALMRARGELVCPGDVEAALERARKQGERR